MTEIHMTPQHSGIGLFSRLSTMMFVLFFVWGAWYPTMGTFMTENGLSAHISWAYSVAPIAAILMPFFMGVFADRLVKRKNFKVFC